jgi:hypothetical protein
MRMYFPNIDDAELALFELARFGISFNGPDCECGKACELGINPVCEEIFLSAHTSDRERIVELIRDEAEVEEFRIEVYNGKEESAAGTRKKARENAFNHTD